MSDAADPIDSAPRSIPQDVMVAGLLAASRIRVIPPAVSEPARAVNPDPWVAGIARLQSMAPLPGFTPSRWRRLQIDCAGLLDQLGDAMRRLDWSTADAFGIHPTSPWEAIQCYGLGLLLDGGHVMDLAAAGATIEHAGEVRLTFARTLMPSAVPIWSVGQVAPDNPRWHASWHARLGSTRSGEL